jgi:hypothetical protein
MSSPGDSSELDFDLELGSEKKRAWIIGGKTEPLSDCKNPQFVLTNALPAARPKLIFTRRRQASRLCETELKGSGFERSRLPDQRPREAK